MKFYYRLCARIIPSDSWAAKVILYPDMQRLAVSKDPAVQLFNRCLLGRLRFYNMLTGFSPYRFKKYAEDNLDKATAEIIIKACSGLEKDQNYVTLLTDLYNCIKKGLKEFFARQYN